MQPQGCDAISNVVPIKGCVEPGKRLSVKVGLLFTRSRLLRDPSLLLKAEIRALESPLCWRTGTISRSSKEQSNKGIGMYPLYASYEDYCKGQLKRMSTA